MRSHDPIIQRLRQPTSFPSTLRKSRLALALSGFGLTIAASAQATSAPQQAASAPATAASASSTRGANTAEVVQVVITAEKRGSTVQKTPLSITAISGEDIEERGISSAIDLARETPGVAVKAGGPGQTEYTIRGLSSSAGVSPTVGIYLDEIPVSPPTLTTVGKVAIDPDLYDLARVEVLRGPQGTLYGASSMGGTIKLVPNSPKLNALQGSVRISGSGTQGGGANGSVDAMVNVPLLQDVAALRVVVTEKHQSGWIDRVVINDFPLPATGSGGTFYDAPRGNLIGVTPSKVYRDVNTEDLQGVRATLLLKPIAGLTITPSFFAQEVKQAGPDTYDAQPGTEAHYQPYDISEPYRDRFSIGSVKANWDFDKVSLTSASAYIQRNRSTVQDSSETMFKALADTFGLTSYGGSGGFGPASITETEPTKQFTQELRLSSNGDGPLRWIIGAFYSRLRSSYDAEEIVPGGADLAGTTNFYTATLKDDLRQSALFGNVSYDLSSQLRLTGGLRYFKSKDRAANNDSGLFSSGVGEDTTASSKGFNPMANLAYTLDKNSMVYVNVAKGFRDGAAQHGVPSSCAADLEGLGLTESPRRYGPDSVWSYEIGNKNLLMDGMLTINASLYHMDWSHVQQVVSLPTCGFTFTANAANAAVNGFELEAVANTHIGLSLEQSVALSRARFTSTNSYTGTNSGDHLLNVPDWTATTALRYSRSVNDDYDWMTRLSATYVGSQDALAAQRETLPSYILMGLRSSLQAETWTATFFIDNLTNRRVSFNDTESLTINTPGLDRISTNRPRTVGLELNKQF